MKYKNAKGILPKNLLKEIQKYIQGEFIYIPITEKNKVGWGQKNGAREMMYCRDEKRRPASEYKIKTRGSI